MGLLYVYVTDPVASKLGPGRIIKRLLDTIKRHIAQIFLHGAINDTANGAGPT